MNMADVITCFGKRLTICNPSGLQELINFCKPNTKWQNDLDTYYNNPKGIYVFEHHKDNCKLLSSLKNRIFYDFEWQLLKEKWDAIKENFSMVESCDEQKVKEKYQNVTKIFTKEVWKKHRGYKLFSCPYAEINRVYVGLNRGVLCPIIDDESIKKLIKGLIDAGYISVEEEILRTKKENGGWLIRSALICSLFKAINDGDNNKWETLPWSCLQLLSNKRIIELLDNNHNIILTGAPGTGKTFLAQQVAEYFAGKEYVKKIQFHPSYDYTDLVEGMRPSGNNSFSRVDGSFKRFCKCAILGLNVNVSNKELADKEKGYTETIEPSKDPYVFIIDEINRGEVSKIFGEVFFCIEESHRGKEEAMDTQYQNLVPDGDLFKKGFYVPDNVYVIGTMNDIDRSVESMDFAFRRRFAFIEIEATTNMLDSIDIDESQVIEDLKKQMKALNNKIIEPKYGLSTAYQIGGAYFLKFEKYYSAFNNNEKFAYKALWDNHLKGTLFEYFRVLPQEDRKKYMTEMEKAFLGKYFEDKKTKTSKEEQPADTDNTDGQR
jgi:5-methylcytosine-specific restriction endonuclease McrBC GTP-binding regulatory subunit McrB